MSVDSEVEEKMNDIFEIDNTDDAKVIIYKCAELFGFPAYQFYLSAQSDNGMKQAILKHDISYYEDAIKRINALSDSDRMLERAKLQKLLGKSSEELQRLCEHMADMYYK
jgi:hypothetical protein